MLPVYLHSMENLHGAKVRDSTFLVADHRFDSE